MMQPQRLETIGAVAALAVLLVTDCASAYYSPRQGRWLSRDPIGEKGGANLYAFNRNTPPNGYDALGKECCLWIDYDKTIDDPGAHVPRDKAEREGRPTPTQLCSRDECCGGSKCAIGRHCKARILSSNPFAPQPYLGLWGKRWDPGRRKCTTTRVCEGTLFSTISTWNIFGNAASQRDAKIEEMAKHTECDQHVIIDDNNAFPEGQSVYSIPSGGMLVVTRRPPKEWCRAVEECRCNQ